MPRYMYETYNEYVEQASRLGYEETRNYELYRENETSDNRRRWRESQDELRSVLNEFEERWPGDRAAVNASVDGSLDAMEVAEDSRKAMERAQEEDRRTREEEESRSNEREEARRRSERLLRRGASLDSEELPTLTLAVAEASDLEFPTQTTPAQPVSENRSKEV